MSQRPEFIGDSSIERVEQDRLRHSGVAGELTHLVRTVAVPANVALFGGWGSGKSGLGRLLKSELRRLDSSVKFVRFDAFKYAENPLRRHFIAQVARELGNSDPRYSDDLYADQTRATVKLPKAEACRVLGLFLVAAVLSVGVVCAIAAVVAALMPGPFAAAFKSLTAGGPALALTPAAAIAAVVALSSKFFSIDRKVSKPDTEEEFEKLFRSLVKESGAKRLIVFIDELDRCSPSEVVETLETVRTFLEVRPCVFVVAADQAVLEQALTAALEQATPPHALDPIYSAGSEYLDKVFQYQVSVPPLMPRRLTGFALQLTDGCSGVWSEVERERVVGTLIPTYVRSPRRVKTLLNAYVVAYRLAARRHSEGALRSSPKERQEELAKLVCLRHEFPLFAAELVRDPRMPGHVLAHADAIAEGQEASLPVDVSEVVWARASAYARGTARPGVLLHDESESDALAGKATRQALTAHLVGYLRSTRRVPGPLRDLVHLETGGDVFGLAPAFADEIEGLAVAGAHEQCWSRIQALDLPGQAASLRLMAHRSREADTEVERENVVGTLVQIVGRFEAQQGPLKSVATDVAIALDEYIDRGGLVDDAWREGIWEIGVESARQSLLGAVLDRMAPFQASLTSRVLASHGSLPARFKLRVADELASLIRVDPDAAAEALRGQDVESAQELLENAADGIQAQFETLRVAGEQETAEEAAQRSNEFLERLASVAGALDSSLAEVLWAVLLEIEARPARQEFSKHLSAIPPIASKRFALAVLNAAIKRPDSTAWLALLTSSSVEAAEAVEALDQVLERLIGRAFSGEVGEAVAETEGGEIVRLRGGLGPREQAGAFKLDDMEGLEDALEATAALEALDLVRSSERASAQADAVSSLLGKDAGGIQDTGEAARLVGEIALEVLTSGDDGALLDMWGALRSNTWLPEHERRRLLVRSSAALTIRGLSHDESITLSTLASYVEADPDSMAGPVAAWVVAHGGSDESIWGVIDLFHPSLPAPVQSAITQAVQQRSGDEIFEICRRAVESGPVDANLLRTLRFSSASEVKVADLLVDRYKRAGNNRGREEVLELWAALRPSDPGTRKRLIEEVLIPMAGRNAEALGMVLRDLDLARQPPQTKGKLRDALRQAGKDLDREKQVRKKLVEMGWVKEHRFKRDEDVGD